MEFYDIFKSSPVQKIQFRGHELFLKRDDLLHADFGGNKARKFFGFFLKDLSKYRKLVSYGGNQSNAMVSLAAFARHHNLIFEYFTKPLPKFLKEYPIGNLSRALNFGMQLIENEAYTEFISKTQADFPLDTIFVKQGGAMTEAEVGVKLLATEIHAFAVENALTELAVVLPSGTGATAVFLQKHLKFKVFTVPNVGDSEYLKKQFTELVSNPDLHPQIWDFPNKKHQFGALYPEYYEIWQELLIDTKVEFELLYDPKTWLILSEKLADFSCPVMYIHSGGIDGNISMIKRYERFATL